MVPVLLLMLEIHELTHYNKTHTYLAKTSTKGCRWSHTWQTHLTTDNKLKHYIYYTAIIMRSLQCFVTSQPRTAMCLLELMLVQHKFVHF